MATVHWAQHISSEVASLAATSGPYKVDFLGEVPKTDVHYYDNCCKKRVRVYRLRVRGKDGSETEVHRRYSQFQHLVACTPPLDWHLLPPQSFWRLRCSKSFRERRSQQLSELVKQAVELDPHAATLVMSEFLGVAPPGQRSRAEASGILHCIKEGMHEDGASTNGSDDDEFCGDHDETHCSQTLHCVEECLHEGGHGTESDGFVDASHGEDHVEPLRPGTVFCLNRNL